MISIQRRGPSKIRMMMVKKIAELRRLVRMHICYRQMTSRQQTTDDRQTELW